MTRGSVALTDGGIETVLVFHGGFDLPCFASFPLLGDDRGRAAISRYFEPFLDTAQQRGLPFVLDTATWRANPDWGAQLGYDAGALADANRDAAAFAHGLAEGRSDVTISGMIGPARRRLRRRRADERRAGRRVPPLADRRPPR